MRFLTRPEAAARFRDRRVAIVGSGPGVMWNPRGLIDSYDVVVRVNNYKIVGEATGRRTDVYYSFFGNSVHKTPEELQRAGVTLCMAKCPNAHAIDSDWHRRNGKMIGVDFRWIYEKRASWWFCDTYIPELTEFLATFDLLGRRIPSTGFSAVHTILSMRPRELYLTGFDFFRSGIHNVDQKWRAGDPSDLIGHAPEREAAWLNSVRLTSPIVVDAMLAKALQETAAA